MNCIHRVFQFQTLCSEESAPAQTLKLRFISATDPVTLTVLSSKCVTFFIFYEFLLHETTKIVNEL